MALSYLSGDEIGKRKGGAAPTGKTGKTASKGKSARSKVEKKQARQRVTKKVAKVAIAPARAAFLLITSLNALHIANKMARIWNSPPPAAGQLSGREQLTKFWTGVEGDMNKLKAAISKGSKTQINGESIGVAVEAAIATATPLLVALVPMIKLFKAQGKKEEAKEFDDGVNEGKKKLAEDAEVPKGKVSMPANKDAGYVADKDGNPGTDGSKPADGTKPEDGTKPDAEMSSNWSPLGFYFMLGMYTMLLMPGTVLAGIIQSWAFTGMICIPVALSAKAHKVGDIAGVIAFGPINFINRLMRKNHVWNRQ